MTTSSLPIGPDGSVPRTRRRRDQRSSIELPPLHPAQQEVWKVVSERLARYVVLACGRRWGKTSFAALLCVYFALSGKRAWWIAPTTKYARPGWRQIKALAMQVPGAVKKESEKSITFPNGGFVQAHSAHDPDSLRGDAIHLAVFEECGYLATEHVWTAVVRPMLTDYKGQAVFIGTPKGRTWFWRLFQRGLDPLQPEWWCLQMPSSANITIDDLDAEIEAARKDMPELIFRQEYEAEFLDDTHGFFKHVIAAATAEPQSRAMTGHQYVFGMDLGRQDDYTSISVLDCTLQAIVAVIRFNRTNFVEQEDFIKEVYALFLPEVIVCEANSFGMVVIDRLLAQKLPVVPFVTNNASKRFACEAFSVALQDKQVTIVDDPVLTGELMAYEAHQLPGGLWKFGAPSGLHDDTVISTILAWQGFVVEPDAVVVHDDPVSISAY